MKLTLEREVFAKKIQAAISALGNNPIPVLNEALLQVKKDRLFITTSNGEVQLTASMNCQEVEGEAQDVVFDIRLLQTPVTTLKAKEVFLEVNEGIVTLFTKRTKNKYEVPIIYKAENYPLLNAEEWSSPLEVKGSVFSAMIKKASIFVDANNIRPGMQGVCLKSNERVVTMQSVSSSGSIICHLEVMPPEGDGMFTEMESVLIPRAIMNVSPEFEKSPAVKISTDDKRKSLRIHDGGSIVVIRLLEGKFPDCQPFVDKYEPSINMKLLNEDLSLALKRSAGFSNDEGRVRVDMSEESEITIECENTAFKKKAVESVPVSFKSDLMDFTFGINYKFISKCLLTMAGENVFISQLKKSEIVNITDDSAEGFTTLWMIAPMIIKD